MLMRETRLLLEPSDVTHMRLTCTQCNDTTLCRIGSQQEVPLICPFCGAHWRRGTEEPIANSLVRAIMRATNHDGLRVKIQLEVLDVDTTSDLV